MQRSCRPAIGLVAALAGLVFLTVPSASAQVLGGGGYAPAPDPAVANMQSRLDALESDLRKAVGRVEQLGFDLTKARQTAESANAGRLEDEKTIASLTERVNALEALAHGDTAAASNVASGPAEATVNLSAGGAIGLAQPSAPPVDASQLAGDEAGLFEQAKTFMLVPNYPSAQAAFAAFLKKYPKSENASEAQYMMAESMLYQNDYADAADAYGKMLKSYPKSLARAGKPGQAGAGDAADGQEARGVQGAGPAIQQLPEGR